MPVHAGRAADVHGGGELGHFGVVHGLQRVCLHELDRGEPVLVGAGTLDVDPIVRPVRADSPPVAGDLQVIVGNSGRPGSG